ncbi:MAG: hypothetical protein ACP5U1_14430, partial [Desulfomonilaceae bacterium]
TFLGAIVLRYTLMSGGVIDATQFTTSIKLVWYYLALLPFYLVVPFTSSPEKLWPVLLGGLMMTWVMVIIYQTQRKGPSKDPSADVVDSSSHDVINVIILGLGILFLGMAPYQIAGYGASDPKIADTVLAKFGVVYDLHPEWFNFNEASRIYSSASYGIAILFAIASTAWRRASIRNFTQILAATAIGFMATFHAGLSLDWREASLMRNQLLGHLISEAPSVQKGTNFIFVDMELYYKRAAVMRGWSGLRELVRMLYNDPTLGAWYIYPSSKDWPNTGRQQAIVLPSGFISRGIEMRRPAHPSTLLIFRRLGSDLALLNELTAGDGFVKSGVSWQGCASLKSNPARIIQWSQLGFKNRFRSKNPWNTGLISCLDLTKNVFFKSSPQL